MSKMTISQNLNGHLSMKYRSFWSSFDSTNVSASSFHINVFDDESFMYAQLMAIRGLSLLYLSAHMIFLTSSIHRVHYEHLLPQLKISSSPIFKMVLR